MSVIIPIYNAERFIETAIQSVYRQLQPWIEVILINDGSTDKSEQICSRYISEQIHYYYINNAGAGHARNVGIDYAQGEWIIFLDSDDLIIKDFFNQDFFYYLKNRKEELVDIIYMPKIISDIKMEQYPRIEFPENINDIENYLPKLEFWTCIYNADFLKKKNIRFFEYKKQDIETAFRFRAFSNTENILVDKSRVFYIHRVNPMSNVHTWKIENYLEIKALVYFELYNEFDDRDISTTIWLYMQYLHYTVQLLVRRLQIGATVEDLKNLKKVVTKKVYSHKAVLLRKMSIKYRMIDFLLGIYRLPIVSKFYGLLCTKHMAPVNKEEVTQIEKDNIDLIFKQMDKYEKIISKILQSESYTKK